MEFKGQKIQVNELLISKLISTKRLNDLAYYALLKNKHQNGVIYGFTYVGIADILGISRKQAYKIVADLVDSKFCEIQNTKSGSRHLRVLSFKSIMKSYGIYSKHKCTIVVEDTDKLQDVKDKLICKLIEQQQRRELYLSKKTESTIKSDSNNTGVTKKNDAKAKTGKLNESDVIVGYRKLAKKLNVGFTSLWKSVKRLKKKKILSARTIVRKIVNMSYSSYIAGKDYFNYTFDGYIFYKKNAIYTCLGTLFTMNQYETKASLYRSEKMSKNDKIRLSKLGR